MKTAALAIALLMGGAAFAQATTNHSTHTTTQPDLDVDADVGVQPDGDLDVDADVDLDTQTTTTTTTTTNHSTMDHSTMSHSTMAHSGTTMASGMVVQPGNAAPERDARGIAVISAPAMVPAGWNGTMGTAMGGPLVDPATGETVGSDATYPACTATVTDNCVQAYTRR